MIYKGAFILKKIYFALVAAIFAVVMPMQIIAKTPMVSFENDKGEFEEEMPIYIDNKKLDGFLDHWFDKNFECANQLCGTTCKYCEDFLNKKINQ